MMEETIDSHREEKAISQQTIPLWEASISSQRQELERQQSLEVSSRRPPGKEALDIKKTFTEINAINDPVDFKFTISI